MNPYKLFLYITILLTPLATFPALSGTFGLAKLSGIFGLILLTADKVARKKNFVLTRFEMPLLIVLSTILINMDYSTWPNDDFFYAIMFLSLFGFLFLVVNSIQKVNDLKVFIMVLLLSSIIPCVSALQQTFFGVDMFGIRPFMGTARASGTFNGANGLSLFCLFMFCISFVFFTQYISWKNSFFAVIALLNLVSGYYSLSRTFLISAGLCVILVAYNQLFPNNFFSRILVGKVMAAKTKKKTAVSRAFTIALLVLGMAYGYSTVTKSPLWKDRMEKTMSGSLYAMDEVRMNDIHLVYQIIVGKNIFIGTGLSNYRRMAGSASSSSMYYSGVPHNIIMHFAVMGGLVGLIALGVMFNNVVGLLKRSRRQGGEYLGFEFPIKATMCLWVVTLFTQGGVVNNYFWILLGLLVVCKNIYRDLSRNVVHIHNTINMANTSYATGR